MIPRRFLLPVVVLAILVAPDLARAESTGAGLQTEARLYPPVVVRAAAVAQTERGFVGSIATISITVASPGSGHVFVDTYPLTQVDMQGSLRLAVRTAGAATGLDPTAFDYFVVMRAASEVVGGPSAGGVTTVGLVAALMNTLPGNNWTIAPDVLMTGTINPDGTIGPVGGVPEKAAAARDVGARVFLYPEGQEVAQVVRAGSATRALNLSEHCARELGIVCKGVGTIEDAIEAFTGHRLTDRVRPGNVTSERFREVLAPLGNALVLNSSGAIKTARANLSGSKDLPASVRDAAAEALSRAGDAQRVAEDAVLAGEHYTAASKSFQAAINARYAGLLAGLFSSPAPGPFMEGAFARAQAAVDRALDTTRNARATTAEELQAFGAAQSRARDAARELAKARAHHAGATGPQGLVDALDRLAYAEERARTAHWWLEIGRGFGGARGLPVGHAEAVARDALAGADALVAYARVVLETAGPNPRADRVEDAHGLLRDAHAAFEEGFVASAIFDALDAEIRASLAIELSAYGETIPEQKVSRSREAAEAAILDARAEGVEPVLAVAYYEFAGALPSREDAISFYKLSRTAARLNGGVTVGNDEPRESRFVGTASERLGGGIAGLPGPLVTGFLLLGGAAGATLGLIFGLLAQRREPARGSVAAPAAVRVPVGRVPESDRPSQPREPTSGGEASTHGEGQLTLEKTQ